jgi:hypothetical protein
LAVQEVGYESFGSRKLGSEVFGVSFMPACPQNRLRFGDLVTRQLRHHRIRFAFSKHPERFTLVAGCQCPVDRQAL